jgi:hypothetical protein
MCYQDTETSTRPPQMPMVALGTRAYLALPTHEGLVDGHAYIIPLQHHLSSLNADDDEWDEIRVRSDPSPYCPDAPGGWADGEKSFVGRFNNNRIL